MLDASALRLGEPAEHAHHEIVRFAFGIDTAADLGYPQLDAVVTEHGEDELELRAGERALRFADNKSVPPPVPVGDVLEQAAGFRSTRPGDRTADVNVVVDANDLTTSRCDQLLGERDLPAARVFG